MMHFMCGGVLGQQVAARGDMGGMNRQAITGQFPASHVKDQGQNTRAPAAHCLPRGMALPVSTTTFHLCPAFGKDMEYGVILANGKSSATRKGLFESNMDENALRLGADLLEHERVVSLVGHQVPAPVPAKSSHPCSPSPSGQQKISRYLLVGSDNSLQNRAVDPSIAQRKPAARLLSSYPPPPLPPLQH